VRARVFAQDGALVADSFRLAGPAGIVEIEPLDPPNWPADLFSRLLTGLYDWVVSVLPGDDGYPRYAERPEQRASDYDEVTRSLTGESASMVRRDEDGKLILSTSVPVQRYRQVLGALMLSVEGTEIEESVRSLRFDILAVFGMALTVTVLLRSISPAPSRARSAVWRTPPSACGAATAARSTFPISRAGATRSAISRARCAT
jgi:two-component system sensor histidine kinase ChvG